MPSDHRRKQAARAYQAAHGVSYTQARRATELSPRRDRRCRAAATLAVPRHDVCVGLLRAISMKPFDNRFVDGLVKVMLAKIDETLPPPTLPSLPATRGLFDDEPDSRLWAAVMASLATTGAVTPEIQAVADYVIELVGALDNQQLVAAATDLGVKQHDVNYLVKGMYENGLGVTGRPRNIEAILVNHPPHWLPGAKPPQSWAAMKGWPELKRDVEQVTAMADAHLRDRSGLSWDDYDRSVIRQAVSKYLAMIGDEYICASEDIQPLNWSRLPEGSLQVAVKIPGRSGTVTALLTAARLPRSTSTTLPPEFHTEFYPSGRPQHSDRYACYVDTFDGTENESTEFTEIFSCEPQTQLRAQRDAADAIAEYLADL